MKKTYIIICTAVGLLLPAYSSQSKGHETITTATLYQEMSDLHRLTYFPNPSYRTVQYSSYDRRSNLPQGPDWFANSDGFGRESIPNFEQVLREPDDQGIGEYLIADITGPGAIVRLWSAAMTGDVRLYLDGAKEPVYNGKAIDFFQRTLNNFPEIDGLDRERLEKTVYQRDACYAPFPFSKQMRLIWTGDVNTVHFYQVQVRIYDPKARLVTFAPQDLKTYADTINLVTQELADPEKFLKYRSQENSQEFQVDLKPGTKEDVLTWKGPQALERLSLKLKADDIDLALRQTVLHVICDGYPWGQVQSPVGDYFGAAPGINPYQSLPFNVFPDGTMVSRFVMPFAESLIIRLENFGNQKVGVEGSALPYPEYKWDPESSLHFRARWRAEHDLVASNEDVQDLAFLVANGKGLYVGTTSYLLNPNQVPSQGGNWWGEGDEKVFVDNEPRPSIFGTGSEDYYNYSWSSPDIFFYPYCGQPRNDGPGTRGFVTNFRWHILDPIPFEQNIRFYMELYSHERTPGLSYARMAYHYARPGLTDDHRIIMPKDLQPLELPDGWQPAARRGARNSEIYPAEKLLADKTGTEFRTGRLWAGGKILVWSPGKSGETKTFDIPVPEKNRYRIWVTAALNPESGSFALQFDKKNVTLRDKTEHIDLYRPYRQLLRNFAIQDLELESGLHTLSLIYLSALSHITNPEIGIDFIWVQKIGQ